MNKQKQNYVAPEAQTLVVGFEGMVCQSPLNQFNTNNFTEYFGGSDDVDDL